MHRPEPALVTPERFHSISVQCIMLNHWRYCSAGVQHVNLQLKLDPTLFQRAEAQSRFDETHPQSTHVVQ